MGMKICSLVLLAVFLFVSCKGGEKKSETYAHIIERKLLGQNKLQISYSFTNEGKIYKGDTTINNMIVPNDSILVTFATENPNQSKVQIP